MSNDQVEPDGNANFGSDGSKLENVVNSVSSKLSHKKWRALLKKQKRKQKRQFIAQEDKKEKEEISPRRKDFEERQLQMKLQYQEGLRIALHEKWLLRENVAKDKFIQKQKWEELEKQKKLEEEKRIREEWEEREKQEKLENERKQEEDEEKKKRQEELLKEATKNEKKGGDGPWKNPEAPVLLPGVERETCPFFRKVGACRFGERCSRGHPYPASSTTILLPGLYSHFKLNISLRDELSKDIGLECEDSETYQHFKEFYYDTLPEFQKFGRVIQFKVCANYEQHLRGNVYVEYDSETDALNAQMAFNGRWYAKRQISCELTYIEKWRNAICGVFNRNKCPKGKTCNFLHCFLNPGHEFWQRDLDRDMRRNRRVRSERSERSGRLERSERGHRRGRGHSSRSPSPSYGSSRSSKRRDFRYQSRSPSRTKGRSRSPRDRNSSRRNISRRYPTRRHSRSPSRYSRSRSRDRSGSPNDRDSRSRSRSRDRSRSPSDRSISNYSKRRSKRSRSPYSRNRSRSKSREKSRSSYRRYNKRSRSKSPDKDRHRSKSRSKSPSRHFTKSRSKSPPAEKHSKDRSRSPSYSVHKGRNYRNRSSRSPQSERRSDKRSRSKSKSPADSYYSSSQKMAKFSQTRRRYSSSSSSSSSSDWSSPGSSIGSQTPQIKVQMPKQIPSQTSGSTIKPNITDGASNPLSLKYLDTASESEGWSTPDYEYDSDGYVVLVAGKPRVKQMDIGEKAKKSKIPSAEEKIKKHKKKKKKKKLKKNKSRTKKSSDKTSMVVSTKQNSSEWDIDLSGEKVKQTQQILVRKQVGDILKNKLKNDHSDISCDNSDSMKDEFETFVIMADQPSSISGNIDSGKDLNCDTSTLLGKDVMNIEGLNTIYCDNKTKDSLVKDGPNIHNIPLMGEKTRVRELVGEFSMENVLDRNILDSVENKDKALEFLDDLIADIEKK